MQKEINFYQEMASEHRLQEYSKGTITLYNVKSLHIIKLKDRIIFIPRWLIMDVLLKVFFDHNGPLFTGCSLDDDNIQ